MAEYSLPPQLQQGAPDVAQKFLSGVQLGASIGEAKNRLAQSQQQFAVEAQQKQDQITASALKEAQELQVSKAYNDQQISLKQQALEIADKKVGAETIKAARQFQAQQSYQRDFQDELQRNGGNQDAAAKTAMFKNLGMFGTGAGAATAASRLAVAPKDTSLRYETDKESGQRFAVTAQGHAIPIKQVNAQIPSNVLIRAKDETGALVPNTFVGQNGRVIHATAPKPNPRVKELEDGVLGQYLKSGTAPDPKLKNLAAAYPAAKKEYDALKATPNTTPAAATTAPGESTGERVKVRSPDGSTGTIPKSQLDDAIDAGYEQVE